MIGRLVNAAGVAFGLLAGVFLLLALINVPDEDLTPAALTLLVPRQAETSPETNGFFDFMGLGAPRGEDARKWGQARVEALRRAAERRDTGSVDYKKAAANPWPSFPCPQLAAGDKSCLLLARSRPDPTAGWRTRNAEPIARYRGLREFQNFEDTLDPPPSNLAEAVHRAVLMEVLALFEAGKPAEALRELAQEIDLHRRMLAGARGLPMKMFAANALAQDYYLLSNLVETEPAVMARMLGEVQKLARPLSGRELDLTGAARERYSAIARNMMSPGHWADWTPYAEHPLLWGLMPRLFYKRRATTNLHARNVESMLALTKVPSTELLARDDELRAVLTARADICCSPYNVSGRLVTDIETPAPYLERIYDLDGLIRLVNLQAQVAGRKVAVADVPGFLAQSPPELTDPYTGKPMQWNAAERKVFFESRQLGGAGWMPKRKEKDKAKVEAKIP